MGKTIRKMAVVGAGTMGAAIAACGARAGLDVILMVRGKGTVSGRDRAAKAVEDILKKGEKKGSAEARIRAALRPADMQEEATLLEDCDLVIEAVCLDYFNFITLCILNCIPFDLETVLQRSN
ncbi:MAG: hypothetical protein IKZ19_01595, partial [Clostridia bacterium]|nr:hypothetical protein [Clostridia bacterium]